jgi:ketosteroid isomerase-like protein
MMAAWSDLDIRQTSIIGAPDGEEFAIHMEISGKSSVSGRPFSMQLLERWVVRGGKIVLIEPYYWDTALLAALHKPD